MSDVNTAIEAITKVIRNSSDKVLLVSGALAHEAYDSKQMQEVVKAAIGRGVKFDIIVGPNYDRESHFILDTLKPNIWLAQEWPKRHFVVGDTKHIRYETDHQELDGSPVADNMVALNMPDLAEFLTLRFNELKPNCKHLEAQGI